MNFSKYSFTTFTVTVADPAVFTSTAHELYTDDELIFETTGALPTGLTADTVTYYVIRNGIAANTFQVSTTKGDTAGLVTTGTQSGTHTYLKVNRASLKPTYEDNR